MTSKPVHKRVRYSAETKAAAMAALMEGQSVSKVCASYHLPKGTVSNWKRREVFPEDCGVPSPGTQKEEVGELVLGYLHANLNALRTQAELFADRGWLEKQDAQEIAVLHGIMTDKAVRLLEALSAGEDG